jgi:leucyl-tRNA synthetase
MGKDPDSDNPEFKNGPRPTWKNFSWDFDFEKIKKLSGEIVVLSDLKEEDRVFYMKYISEKLDATLVEGYAEDEHFTGDTEPIMLKSLIPSIKVFTTRPDTLFGVTYVVLAPEHPLVRELLPSIKNRSEALVYIAKTKKESDIQRTDATREKTGVELKGIKAINPVNGEEVPVYIADYVLADYGTGAVMAVPAHDERDFEFAKKYGLPIKQVIFQNDGKFRDTINVKANIEEGVLINSGKFNDFTSENVKKEITTFAGGQWISKYKLRDWVFSRQRYWGEPIPVVHCEKCGIVPVPEKDLPVKLPPVKNYKPTETGESPLAAIDKWVNVKCPKCKGNAKREADTMPNWAGSSWYYLRYTDPNNATKFADMKKLKYWTPVDWYNGGMEHVTLHLLYSRFWHKFLFDQGLVPTSEPYTKRTAHGLVLAKGGEKMSKSRGNVINPDGIVEKVGADSLRFYEMFMGPFDQAIAWDENGIVGCRRFLERVWKLQEKVTGNPVTPVKTGVLSNDKVSNTGSSKVIIKQSVQQDSRLRGNDKLLSLIQKTIKKVSEDIENMKFNTAVSALMILLNEFESSSAKATEDKEIVLQEHYETLLQLLAPFAPHITEELWNILGHKKSIHIEPWPVFDPSFLLESSVKIAVQVNGKTRAEMEIAADASDEAIQAAALDLESVKKWLNGKAPARMIVVKGRLINIVCPRTTLG